MTVIYEWTTWLTQHTGDEGFDCYFAAREKDEIYLSEGWQVAWRDIGIDQVFTVYKRKSR